MVRALFRAIETPAGFAESTSLYCKVYYPALYGGTQIEKNTGALPAAQSGAPYPVAILMPGINVSPESYGWLARSLTAAGFVSVIYGLTAEEMPGMVALSPGLDVTAMTPDKYGQKPSATLLTTLLDDLQRQNEEGPLAGLLDLDRILLGGHSAGGSVALMNANPEWFPGLKAAFAYGSHSKASTMLGYEPDTVLDLPSQIPLMILGGSEDGVIAASSFRYDGDESGEAQPQKGDPVGPLQRTFDEAIHRNEGDCYLAVVTGANHFTFAWPADPATGRPFLDWPETRPSEELRNSLEGLVINFAQAFVCGDEKAKSALDGTITNHDQFSPAKQR